MNRIGKERLVKDIPLFSQFTPGELALIMQRCRLVEYKKGQLIYAQGAPASAFYCIVSGRVLIYTEDKKANRSVLEYLHRGSYFGIISLLTDEPHSVSAQAINDCLALAIEKNDFDFLLKNIPRLAIDLSRSLSRRLKRKDIHQKTIFESTVISVFSSYSRAGKTTYALNLSLSLAKETRKSVVILDILPKEALHSLPAKLSLEQPRIFDLSSSRPDGWKEFIMHSAFSLDLLCFYYEDENDACIGKLVEILSILVNDYHYIILDLPSVMDRSIINMLNQSDLVHILSSPDELDLKKTNNLSQRLKNEFNFDAQKIKIIINEYKLAKIDHQRQTELLGSEIFATVPRINFESGQRLIFDEPDSEYSRAIRRISRQVGDCLVGLVLGVGVGYGFCHIGVLKVIEDERIPIDVIAGSSIGALIASLWATGMTSSQILEITREFNEPKHIWGLVDFTFPRLGFIKGDKLHRFLKRHLGEKTFYDVRLPLKIIASDLRRKEPRILDKGSLVDAIMASCSMPGVFAPFKFKEEVLFDGGIIYPLPTEALFKSGIKKIIAVNVTPSREDVLRQVDRLKEDMVSPASPAGAKKGEWMSLGVKIKNIFKTNIIDIIFSSVEALQSEVAKKEEELADVVLHPDTQGLFWLELHKAGEFSRRGEIEARRNLDKIWQLVNE